MYNDFMSFEWDPNKNKINIKKHNLSFEESVPLFDKPHLTKVSQGNYKETRYISIGALNKNSIILIVYTKRNKSIRIISARIAKKKERKSYHDHIKKTA